ncbi:MAG: IS481 family transposase [Actinobacteria bacterium]|nr:IS481 family transposase [Actinomycetota bacterium]
MSVVEQRYHAVMEVISGGVPVVEVAERYGVSRKTVHAWLRRYRQDGLPGLTDRSHRPHHHPGQLAAEVEARVCELRRTHPRWGSRRLVHELRRLGITPVPSRSTVYRVLVRHSLVTAIARKRRREDYRRWERSAPMQLWQLDVMGSVFIKDPSTPDGVVEAKLISGIDDHSRYSVIGTVVPRASARAVCSAFVAAMTEYGVPDEVLSDNGRQFTGRFGAPRPAEVLFERICRHNGITQRLTKPRSPTTTGKVERWHQTIQVELLDPHGPFDSLEAAQAAVDAWRTEYNTVRPHQALDMATPAQRFIPVPVEQRGVLGLWLPPELAPTGPSVGNPESLDSIDDEPDESVAHAADSIPATDATTVEQPVRTLGEALAIDAVEIDRLVPASGNLGVCGQQFWLGPARAGRTLTLWIDTTTVHLSLDGQHLKTLPSRLTSIDLARLRAHGARPAGLPPARPSWTQLSAGAPVEIHRTANAVGMVSIAGTYHSVGQQFAGRRITLRLEATLAHVVVDGVLVRTIALTLTPTQRARLQGARLPGPAPLLDQRPTRVQRTVSCRGGTQIIGQRVQVGLCYAGQIVTIEVDETTLRVYDQRHHLIKNVPRTSRKEVRRHKAYGHTTSHTTA